MDFRPIALIVDDEPEILATIQRRLRIDEIQSEITDNPTIAIDMMKQRMFPIVVCDVRMPEMSGVDLIGKLREVNPLCNVIMITAYSSIDSVITCLNHGAVDYFVKPFQNIDWIVQAVAEAKQRVDRWGQTLPIASEGVKQEAT